MDAWVWVVIVLAVVLVIALVLLNQRRNRRRAALRERFGPEYERAVRQSKDRRAVEKHLEEVSQKRDTLEIRELSPQAAAGYQEQWERTQARFVDEPGQAVADADSLVTAVMRERGYPMEDFDDRAALVATDHPDVVQHYRAAHDAYARHLKTGDTDTEDLRKAFVHYRSLFTVLTRPGDAGRDRDGDGQPDAPAASATPPGADAGERPPAPPADPGSARQGDASDEPAAVRADEAAVAQEPPVRTHGRHADVPPGRRNRPDAPDAPDEIDVRDPAPEQPEAR